MSGQNGKGDSPRPFNRKKWDNNYDAVFKKKRKKDKNGNTRNSRLFPNREY